MDRQFSTYLETKGIRDGQGDKVIFYDTAPHLSKPVEREFFDIFKAKLIKEGGVMGYDLGDPAIPTTKLPHKTQAKMVTAFLKVNAVKVMRKVGVKVGPAYLDKVKGLVWRPAIWKAPKVGKYWGFVGIPHLDQPHADYHPVDSVRSSRFHNALMIRECPDPDILACEDYEKQHIHGLVGLTNLMAVTFVDLHPTNRTFRVYGLQGCTRLYHMDELATNPRVFQEIRAKVVVKGRMPRSADFCLSFRHQWGSSRHPLVKAYQQQVLHLMKGFSPLLPIKMGPMELAHHAVLNLTPIYIDKLLDGRSGMSYGFLACQLPTGPVESCQEVRVLCTRSGCDKTSPDGEKDWVVLTYEMRQGGGKGAMGLDVNKAMKHITSPSFDSWLILGQAAANLSMAQRFKQSGVCSNFVSMVEEKGLAICHFHGFVRRTSLHPNMAFFGQEELPLPCGSVEAAHLTIRAKQEISDQIVAMGNNKDDIQYIGDIHIEPDHGVVVSCSFSELERVTHPQNASYGLGHFKSYKGVQWAPPPTTTTTAITTTTITTSTSAA